MWRAVELVWRVRVTLAMLREARQPRAEQWLRALRGRMELERARNRVTWRSLPRVSARCVGRGTGVEPQMEHERVACVRGSDA